MGIITSPVKKWPGTVLLPDYLTWPQFLAWREGVTAAQAERDKNKPAGAGDLATWQYDADAYRHAFLTGVCGVVQEWHLSGLPEHMTPELFPARPYQAAQALFDWLVAEITRVVAGEVADDPK